MSEGWWARKLAQPEPQRPQQTTYAPMAPTAPQSPAVPMQTPQQQWRPANFTEAVRAVEAGVLPTHGAEAARTEQQRCPNCGSPHYFSRRNTGGVTTQRGMAAPAPQCYACNYNGRFSQGDPAVWGATA